MRIAIIGASGNVGTRIVSELVARGHHITAISRNPAAATNPMVTAVAGDASDPAGLANILAGHDAVVSSVRFIDSDPAKLIAAVRQSGVKRYLIVGGAGSLEVAPGKRLVDAPGFPDAYKAEALAGAAFLDSIRPVADLDWTYLSPSAFFGPGERTGTFRRAGDTLLVDTHGKSAISYEDFALAMADEIETPNHVRGRFTVGY